MVQSRKRLEYDQENAIIHLMRTISQLLLFLTLGIFTSSVFTSCESCVDGNGSVIIEDRAIESYSKLEVDISAEVTIIPGEDLFIRVEAQESLLPIIKTTISGKTLKIKSKPCIQSDEPIRITLTVPTLTAVSINGSGSVKTLEIMNTEDLDIAINGSGTFIGDVFANSVNASINGSGNILINGSAKKLEIEINGSGDFRGLGLKSFEAIVAVRGSGNVDVNALNELSVEVLGSGDVRYIGNPKISTSIVGSGEVSKKN